MKIAYITSSLEGGGAYLPVPAVTRVLRNAGAHVEVFALTRRDGRALPSMLADNLQVNIREGGDKDHKAAYVWLRKKMIEYQPSIIWTSVARASIIGLLIGRHLSISVVCWQHCAYLKPVTRWLYYILRKQAIMWIGDSDSVTAITAKRFNVPNNKLATWPLFSSDPNAPQSTPWKPGQVLRIGSLGRLHTQKSYHVLVEALALLKRRDFVSPVKYEISIAGEGPERASLTRAIQKTGCKELKLVGYAKQPQQFLADLHLYLQPSSREGFCIAVHEAMQAGLPVIASSVGQIKYTLTNGYSGWLVPSGDAIALANVLADALSNPTKLAEMGRAGRKQIVPVYNAELFRQSGKDILERLQEKLGVSLDST